MGAPVVGPSDRQRPLAARGRTELYAAGDGRHGAALGQACPRERRKSEPESGARSHGRQTLPSAYCVRVIIVRVETRRQQLGARECPLRMLVSFYPS